MKKPEKFYCQGALGMSKHYNSEEMDAYLAHLEQARDEAKPLIEWAANSEFREFKNWLSKYGVDNGKT